ncbi:MAG: epoxyqueuosine reductase QueH [Candidatus Dojkabacteria bacterium]|nr:epoxyqueuosine reductase QueH [Candidatus Dojkabacteria bacterium]
MKTLIHTCCADCLLTCIRGLDIAPSDIYIYFYNPNIHPKSEYNERLKALKLVLEKYSLKDAKLIIPDYKPKEYFEAIPKSKKRCVHCWELRLKNTFEYAAVNNIEAVTTTLLSSHYQNKKVIENIGNDLSREYNIKFIIPKIKNNTINKGFYKQNYCGCCYSLIEKMNEKYPLN